MPGRGVRLPVEALKILKTCAKFSDDPVYLVGGALRDFILDRATDDLDVACFAPKELAKSLQRAFGGTLVVLDDKNAVFRLVFPLHFKTIRQIDLSLIQGADILNDLGRRDFTVNAMALELSGDLGRTLSGARILDPFNGKSDLKKKIIRCKQRSVLADDPLRLLRAFRLAAQLGFKIDSGTLKMISILKKSARKPAAERIKTEIAEIFSAPHAGEWAGVMDASGLLTAIFPQMEKTRSCAEVYYGKGGVLKHSLETLNRMDFLLENIDAVFGGLSRRIRLDMEKSDLGNNQFQSFLRLVSFLHDVAKPDSAKMIDGRLRFFCHDEIGAKKIALMLKDLRFSRDWIDGASAIVLHHLRPGNLAANQVVSDRAAYRFFRDVGKHSLGLLLVCWSDHASYILESRLRRHLKLLGENPGTFSSAVLEEEKKTVRHLQVISFLMKRLLDTKNKAVPDPVVNGRDVMKVLGIKPGPEVGAWLERVREAQAGLKIKTRQDALAYLSKSKKRTA